MANFSEAYLILQMAEFNGREDKFLHKNKGEDGYTLGGVYQKYHQDRIDWDFVSCVVGCCQETDVKGGKLNVLDLKRPSIMLYADRVIKKQVYDFFEDEFWLKNKLNEIHSQKIANEIFISSTNIGNRNAIKLAQKLIGTTADGKIGPITVKALNIYNEDAFDIKFDQKEREYYDSLIARNPRLAIFKNGWANRSNIV